MVIKKVLKSVITSVKGLGVFRSGDRMENSAPQTQYLGHVFIDVIFRFSPRSLCVRAGPFPVMPHVATPQSNTRQHRSLVLTRRPADADSSSSSPLLYDFPTGTDLVSFRET